jgi:hypothetical protein
MKITNKLNLPFGMVKAVSVERHNADRCISATTLLQGMKQVILTDRHWDDLSDDVSDRIWAIFGTTVHSLMESEGENDFTEQDISFPVKDVTVTGRIDNYDMKNGVICDYKTASVWKVRFNDFDDWYKQGMIYAWLLIKNGFKAEKCRFIALLKDHSKTDASRESNYPQQPVFIYEFDVTFNKLAEIEQFIFGRVEEYIKNVNLADNEIPPCNWEERWEKPTVYAIKKSGRKTAVKLLYTEESADEFLKTLDKNHYIEKRVGESVKCKSYCLCRPFCNFYQENVKSADTTETSVAETTSTGDSTETAA